MPRATRREILSAAIAAGLLPLLPKTAAASAPLGPPTPFSFDWLREEARRLAREPYAPPLTGDEALLEAVGASSGTLSVAAAGYESHEEKLAEPPGMLHEVSLEILPPSRVEARVITPAGDPVAGAAVELVVDDPLEPSRIAAADEAGAVVFPDVPVSALRLTATLDGRSSQTVRIPRNVRSGVVLTLDRSPR